MVVGLRRVQGCWVVQRYLGWRSKVYVSSVVRLGYLMDVYI